MALDGALEPIVPARPLTTTLSGKPDIAALESRIGHTFAQSGLLARALTHVSADKLRSRVDSYQRLEFLGDRVLGLTIAEMLYELFPGAEEGELSRRFSALVRKETCAEVARGWDVGPHLALGRGEKASARDSAGVLGDVCESILGAVFLDAGFDTARDLVRRAFGDRLNAPGVILDPKTALQEWAQGAGRAPPSYREVSRGGPAHKPVFVIAVDVEGFDGATAEGSSKRMGEQAAAALFAEKHNLAIAARRAAVAPNKSGVGA